MTLAIIAIVIFLIYAAGKSNPKPVGKKEPAAKNSMESIKNSDAIINNIYAKSIKMTSLNSENDNKDNSIIDITAEGYPLNRNTGFSYNNFVAQFWGLGTKYKSKLKLTDSEVKILDALIDTDNKFNSIDFIAIEIIRLFFDTLNHLKEHFAELRTSFDDNINAIAEIELTSHYKLWKNSNSYNSQLSVFPNTINQCIFKACENSLRDYFFIGRKTDMKWYIRSDEALYEFNNRVNNPVQDYFTKRIPEMKQPDEAAEKELNEYNRARWKNKLEQLKEVCGNEHSLFYENTVQLGSHNKTNPAVENIFFDASKFISKINKETSLKLYVHYIYYDLHSATIDNKQLAKTIQKSLFANNEQLLDFQQLINKLITDRDLDNALKAVPLINLPKRKKIQVDTSKIKEVLDQHSGTVELLNQYLQDESENGNRNETASGEVNLVVNYKVDVDTVAVYKFSDKLSGIQVDTLSFFSKKGFSVPEAEFDVFIKSKAVFKNSLVESLNDTYFELLDDVLIEDNGDDLTINESYYNKILNQ